MILKFAFPDHGDARPLQEVSQSVLWQTVLKNHRARDVALAVEEQSGNRLERELWVSLVQNWVSFFTFPSAVLSSRCCSYQSRYAKWLIWRNILLFLTFHRFSDKKLRLSLKRFRIVLSMRFFIISTFIFPDLSFPWAIVATQCYFRLSASFFFHSNTR